MDRRSGSHIHAVPFLDKAMTVPSIRRFSKLCRSVNGPFAKGSENKPCVILQRWDTLRANLLRFVHIQAPLEVAELYLIIVIAPWY